MSAALACLAGGGGGFLALLALRGASEQRAPDDDAPKDGGVGREVVLQILAALTAGGILAGLVLSALPPVLERAPGGVWGVGAVLGIAGLLGVQGTRTGTILLARWADRRPLELPKAAISARSLGVSLLGYAAFGSLLAGAVSSLPSGYRGLLLPVAVLLFPLFDTAVKPLLTLVRSPGLSEGALGVEAATKAVELEAWVRRVQPELGVGPVHIRVQPGGMVNAYAIGVGGVLGHWIVVGEALLREAALPELRGILAHELAHVANRDIPRYLVAAGAAGTVYALSLPFVFRLFEAGLTLGALALAGGVGVLCFALVPGWVSRRAEFRADRTALTVLSRPGDLAAGLRRIAKLKGHALNRESLTHPSVEARVRALGAHGP